MAYFTCRNAFAIFVFINAFIYDPNEKLFTHLLGSGKAFLSNACGSHRLLQLAKQPNYRTQPTLLYIFFIFYFCNIPNAQNTRREVIL